MGENEADERSWVRFTVAYPVGLRHMSYDGEILFVCEPVFGKI